MKPDDQDPDPAQTEFGAAYQALLDHCLLHEIHHQAFPEEKAVRFAVRGETAIYNCTLRVAYDDEVLQIRVEFPVVAGNPTVLAQTAEFVARANCGMVIGRLDLNMDGGALAVHIGHVIGAEGLTEEVLHNFMGAAINTAERYFPGLMRMMFGGHVPADAIYLCELESADSTTTAGESAPPAPAADADQPAAKKRKTRARRTAKPGQGAPGEDQPEAPGEAAAGPD